MWYNKKNKAESRLYFRIHTNLVIIVLLYTHRGQEIILIQFIERDQQRDSRVFG